MESRATLSLFDVGFSPSMWAGLIPGFYASRGGRRRKTSAPACQDLHCLLILIPRPSYTYNGAPRAGGWGQDLDQDPKLSP
eukprot:4270399-Pyramimonas_sp.AAC.2